MMPITENQMPWEKEKKMLNVWKYYDNTTHIKTERGHHCENPIKTERGIWSLHRHIWSCRICRSGNGVETLRLNCKSIDQILW